MAKYLINKKSFLIVLSIIIFIPTVYDFGQNTC